MVKFLKWLGIVQGSVRRKRLTDHFRPKLEFLEARDVPSAGDLIRGSEPVER